MLHLAEKARQLAERDAEPGTRYDLSASNVDLLDPGISFGTHASLSGSRELWENTFVDPRYPAVLGFLASAVAAAIPFFGSGYLLPLENGNVTFSLYEQDMVAIRAKFRAGFVVADTLSFETGEQSWPFAVLEGDESS